MLTSIPPRALHTVVTVVEHIKDLADLGLAMLCPCATCHASPIREWLDEDSATLTGT